MREIKKVVVGVDGSPHCRAALREAARIAIAYGAQLHVIQVVTADLIEHLREADLAPTNAILAEIRGGLHGFVRSHLGKDLPAEMLRLEVIVGHPFEEIAGMTEETGAELLVLGAQGWHEDARRTGMTAKKCVRHAGCPVLLVRKEHGEGYRRIGACVDFSEAAARALSTAADLAHHEGATLDVVHVHYPPWLSPVSVEYNLRQTVSEDYRKQYLDLLRDRMEEWIEPVRRAVPSVPLTPHILEHTNVVYGLTQFLRDHDIDLAAVGTHGGRGLRPALLGTTAERLLHTSPCSVLMTPPREEAAPESG
ncbi:MAG TPA: universal stress protein [Verrucomicrobiales bacterium]|nr:universal stress protein [Verrucomicrobiales bacterium]